MDPSSIPPPATNTLPIPAVPAAVPFTSEPNNHPLAANPAPISPPPLNHPPYAEMIYTAIEALKEKNGSSKRAIAKYIEQVYKDQLPPTHSTLLTHHLKRLKNNGMLQMVKKSYKLPRSASASASAASASAPAPPPLPSSSAPPQASRPRGRPRKVQAHAQAQPQDLQVQPVPVDDANVVLQNAEPVWAALGLADEPQPAAVQGVPATEFPRRSPGRPRKRAAGSGAGHVSPLAPTPGRRGRPPGSKNKKRPGRPSKSKPESAAPAAAASSGTKRRPGRPPKNQSQPTPIPFAPAAAETAEVPVQADVPAGGDAPVATVTPRRRGRPRRKAAAAAAPVVGDVGLGRGQGRGRGRGGRGRGRGRGVLPSQPRAGRPVGRPKKGTPSASTLPNAANEDLRRKLEHFQSKVKDSLAALKPHFSHESPVTAIAAIQELEVLGTVDLNSPLWDETLPQQQQHPPQQQQVQPQQQPLQPQQQQLPPQEHLSHLLAPQQLPQPQIYPQFHLPQYQQQQQPQQYPHQNQHQQPAQQPPQQFQHQPPHQQHLFHP